MKVVTRAATQTLRMGRYQIGERLAERGATPTFLPWAPGEPDNAGNQNCVEVLAATSKLATLQCNTARIAVCECEP